MPRTEKQKEADKAKRRAARRVKDAERLREVEEYWSRDKLERYGFPRDTNPTDMTDQQRKEFQKCFEAMRAQKRYQAQKEEDPDAHKQKLEQIAAKRKEDKARDTTGEAAEAKRAYHRQYMREYNKRKREEDPEGMREKYKSDYKRRHKDRKEPSVSAAPVQATPPSAKATPAVEEAEEEGAGARNPEDGLDEETRRWIKENTRACPGCQGLVQKDGGCNVMRCICGVEFDWTTGAPIPVPKPVAAPVSIRAQAQAQAQTREEVLEEKRQREREWRKANPEAARERDKRKYDKMKEDEERMAKERERQREKERERRAATKADPQAYAAAREADKKRLREREEAMTEEQKAERNAKRRKKYYETKEKVAKEGRTEEGATYGYKQCVTCKYSLCWTYDECWPCRTGKGRIKKQEEEIKAFLEENHLYPSRHDGVGPCKEEGDKAYRCDFILDAHDTNYCIFLEVDEDYHRNYTPECEVVRMHKLRGQLPHKPVFFVRYHPERRQIKRDQVKTSGAIKAASKKVLLECIRTILTLPAPTEDELPCGYNIVFIGYPEARIEELTSTRERLHHEAMDRALKAKEAEAKRLDHMERTRRWREKL